ncbi:MAG: hypothetical protein Q9167_003760 [Letrouitia subvulpina]
MPGFSPKTPTYLATSAQTAALTMTSAASRRPTAPATTTRVFLKQELVDLGKETPYRVTAAVIPVYSPACLGNAYGGGYIIMPTVFVSNPEVKDGDNSTLGYNFSYGQYPSGSAHPNTTMIIIGTISPPPTTSTVTLRKVQPGAPDLTSTPTARSSLRSTLASRGSITSVSQTAVSYGAATSPSRLRTISINGEGRISTLPTFASPTLSNYVGVLSSEDLDVPGKALSNKDSPNKTVLSQNAPSQDLPSKDLVSKVIYSKDRSSNESSSMSHPAKDVLSNDHFRGNRRPGGFNDPVYSQSIASTTSASSKIVQSASYSITPTASYLEKSRFSSSSSTTSNPLAEAGQDADTLDTSPKIYREAITFEFSAFDIRESSPTPPRLHGNALNVSTVSKGNSSSAVSFLGGSGALTANLLATILGFVVHGLFA